MRRDDEVGSVKFVVVLIMGMLVVIAWGLGVRLDDVTARLDVIEARIEAMR